MWTIASFGNSTNPTYDYQALGLWSVVELDVGIMCACMPGVASLLRRMLPSVLGSTRGDSSAKYNTGGSSGYSGSGSRGPAAAHGSGHHSKGSQDLDYPPSTKRIHK